MAKRRKTFRQKLLADKRREVPSLSPTLDTPPVEIQTTRQAYTFEAKTVSKPLIHSVQTQNNYGPLFHDLRKTAFLTGAIVVIQLVVFFVIK